MQDLLGQGPWTNIEPNVANNVGPMSKMALKPTSFVNAGPTILQTKYQCWSNERLLSGYADLTHYFDIQTQLGIETTARNICVFDNLTSEHSQFIVVESNQCILYYQSSKFSLALFNVKLYKLLIREKYFCAPQSGPPHPHLYPHAAISPHPNSYGKYTISGVLPNVHLHIYIYPSQT